MEPKFTPTLGMRTLEQLDEALAAKPLTADQMAQVEKVVPRGAIAGTRYSAAQMLHLDSEKHEPDEKGGGGLRPWTQSGKAVACAPSC